MLVTIDHVLCSLTDTVYKICLFKLTGAWWYTECYDSNLNGEWTDGLIWAAWRGFHYSLRVIKLRLSR